MRDTLKEHSWTEYPIIGYVPLDEKGNPYQPTLGKSWRARKKPVTVYKTMARAVAYSPVSSAVEVRMFQVVDV